MLTESLKFIINWIENQELTGTDEKETFNLHLNPGASQEEIEELETILEQKLPTDLRELLTYANGQAPEFQDSGLQWIPETALLSTQEIAQIWLQGKEWYTYDDDSFNSYDDNDRIRRTLWHNNRIPVWGRLSPDTVAEGIIDGVPGPNGTPGQLIMSVSESEFEVIGTSLAGFFEKYAKLIKEGQLVIRQNRYSCNVEPVNKIGEFDYMQRLFRE